MFTIALRIPVDDPHAYLWCREIAMPFVPRVGDVIALAETVEQTINSGAPMKLDVQVVAVIWDVGETKLTVVVKRDAVPRFAPGALDRGEALQFGFIDPYAGR